MATSPQIASTLPISGALTGGTQVNISGSGLSSATDVYFGLNPATEFDIESDTLIFAVTPAGDEAGSVSITVVTPNGDSVPSTAAEFTYISVTPPSVYSVYPAFGPVTGGTQITITGVDFSGATAVSFGSIPAPQFVANSDGSILVTSPAAANAGIVPVTITTAAGVSGTSPASTFTFMAQQTSGSSGTSSGTGGSGGGSSPGASTTGGGTPSNTSQGGSSSGGNASTTSQGNTAQGNSSQGNTATPSQSNQSNTGSPSGASQTPTSPTGTPSTPSGNAPSSTNPSAPAAASSSTPQPSGNYIPGGLAPVPGGQTGLGTSAGTSQGFGVGTLMAGGGGSAAPSNLSYYVDPGLTGQLVQSLIGLVQNASSPDAVEAQNIILRRMALQGDVIGSRVPPPRNISEIGGYINLLGTLREPAMREQTLAGILGVAGPVEPLGWISDTQPLSMVAITNDRPAVTAQASFPLTVLVRSDFVGPMQAALKTLHSYGAMLPMTSPSAITLPPGGTGAPVPNADSILFYIGRAIEIAPSAALSLPGVDPVALVSSTAVGPFQLGANVLNTPTAPVPTSSQASGDLYAVAATTTSQTVIQMPESPYILIGPTLANAGYYPAFPVPVPANTTATTWSWLTNTTGLVAGVTKLGDELSMLYRQDQIAASVFASMLNWTWNGTAFASS
jgi:hypothetical protein